MHLLAMFAVGSGERLDCFRRDDGSVECTHVTTNGLWPAQTVRFRSNERTRFAAYETPRGAHYGRIEITDAVGRGHLLFDTNRDDAREAHRRFEAFFRDSSTRRFEHATSRNVWGAVVVVALAAAG